MASEIKEIDWKTYMQCKECNEFKELNNTNWYKHNKWFMWVLWRCKECIKKWRKTDNELKMSRVRDRDRYYTDKRWLSNNRNHMKRRCRNNIYYKNINVLRKCFEEFYDDMIDSFLIHKEKYWIHNTTIDRIDNKWHYCKYNCRWATYHTQANNKRNNKIIEYMWEKDTVANICKKYNKNGKLVYRRLVDWWSIKDAIEMKKIPSWYTRNL